MGHYKTYLVRATDAENPSPVAADGSVVTTDAINKKGPAQHERGRGSRQEP